MFSVFHCAISFKNDKKIKEELTNDFTTCCWVASFYCSTVLHLPLSNKTVKAALINTHINH